MDSQRRAGWRSKWVRGLSDIGAVIKILRIEAYVKEKLMLKKEITPLLLGTDLGAYSMAVSFHSALGLVSHAFGRERLGATSYSKIVIPHVIPDLLDPETALRAIRDFSRERELVILVPCDDWYVRLLAGIRDRLPENLLLLMPTREVIERVSDKIEFYKLIDGFGIDYPKTAVFYSERDISVAVLDRFSYPAVVKPADSAEYWAHPFDGMKKVYFVADAPDAEQTVRRIFFSGYSGGVLLQEKIGSANEIMGVYTAVFDKSSVKVCGVFGEVMLGEPTATGAGNHVAIITAQAPEICKMLDNVLEKTGYVGIANFDLISDGERWYALELNPRQGRSCDYTRAAGINLAEAITKILIGEKYRPCAPQQILWRSVQRWVMLKKCPHEKLVLRAGRLISEGKEFSLYSYESITINPVRFAYGVLHGYRHSLRFGRGKL